MVMPFSNEACNHIYTHSIVPICNKFNIEVRRADEIYGTSPIYDDIVKEIQEASIVIVDISDKNPNVFYELGIAHTLKQKRTVIITQDDFSDTPFDIRHFRIINYENSIDGKTKFDLKFESTLLNLLNDRRESFKNEFELTFTIFESSKRQNLMIGLIGIHQYTYPLNKNINISFEGVYGKSETLQFGKVVDLFAPFAKLGYIIFENDITILTEKGVAFVSLLKENGYKCNMFNDQIFIDNYIPYFVRMAEKNKTQLD